MAESKASSFGQATAVVPLSSHTYAGNFLDDWAIGSVPHGGTVAATFARVARLHFSTTLAKQDQPNLMTSHYNFINRTSTGPTLFTVEDVKLGRQTSIIHVTLSQGDRKEVIAYMTHTNFDNEQGPSIETSWEFNPQQLPVDLRLLQQGKDPNWGLIENRPFKNFRKATLRVDMAVPKAGFQQTSCIEQWIRFSTFEHGRRDRFTDVSLGFITDTFPQVIEAIKWPEQYIPPGKTEHDEPAQNKKDKAFWYPTVLMNLEVKKALPSEGVEWMYQRCYVKMIQKGRYDIETIVKDEAGDVVAVSNHVCLIVPATRNTAARKKQGANL